MIIAGSDSRDSRMQGADGDSGPATYMCTFYHLYKGPDGHSVWPHSHRPSLAIGWVLGIYAIYFMSLWDPA